MSGTTWSRRAVTWPILFLATPALFLASPWLFLVALLVDLATGVRRLRAVRVLGMVLTYLALELTGMVVGALLWVLTGFGLGLRTASSQRIHYQVQRWWARRLFAAFERWFGVKLELDNSADAFGDETRLIAAARHTSYFDALVPVVILSQHSARAPRHVLAEELRWDPCLDLYGGRLPNHFVNRANTNRANEAAAIRRLASANDDNLIIFPEGGFPTPRRSRRAFEKLRETSPERVERLPLGTLLPPRPTGILAMLDGAPDADILFVGHRGFERFASFGAIGRNVPFDSPVDVKVWRVSADEIPGTDEDKLAFIDSWWAKIDRWVGETPNP